MLEIKNQEEKIDQNIKTTYPILEQFYSLQGEGFYAGTPCYFIRLGKCDVGCFWCDVKESWDDSTLPRYSVGELVSEVQKTKAERIVITGGEPTLHDLTELTQNLKAYQYKIHLETAGTNPLTGEFDWICFSPKKFKKPILDYYQYANELKIIVYNKHDLMWAEEQASNCHSGMLFYLQPEWSKIEHTEFIIDYIKDHPYWKLSLQTHKYLNIL